MKDVTISDILFPKTFTDALETTATKVLEPQRIREKNAIDLEQAKAAQGQAQAALTAENPSYASYPMNSELASKVHIAVLPLGTESGSLGNMLQPSWGVGSQKNKK